MQSLHFFTTLMPLFAASDSPLRLSLFLLPHTCHSSYTSKCLFSNVRTTLCVCVQCCTVIGYLSTRQSELTEFILFSVQCCTVIGYLSTRQSELTKFVLFSVQCCKVIGYLSTRQSELTKLILFSVQFCTVIGYLSS